METTINDILASLGEKVLRIERLEAEIAAEREKREELERDAAIAERFEQIRQNELAAAGE